MRFKKGSKVEVFSKKEGPSGAWRCGEIVFSGNEQAYYSVRYDCSSGDSNKEDLVEKVPIEVIRPSPPPLVDEFLNSFVAGDVVEVFNDLLWKTASILKVFSPNNYLVRLIGSSEELKLHKINIRMRQLWQDGKWVMIGKNSGFREDRKRNKLSTLSSCLKLGSPTLHAKANKKSKAGESFIAMAKSKTLKRPSPFQPFEVEASNGRALKMRAIEKTDKHLTIKRSSLYVNKVDAFVYNGECLGDMHMYNSPRNQRFASYETETAEPNFYVESFHSRRLESNDSDIDECSVGSCSVISKLSAGKRPDHGALSSDAQSSHGCGEEEEKCFVSLGENVAVRIHRLELHAYRCTLEALYASGPLNWEQEVLLTNLRMSLNVSNDEHLLELRNLISSGTSVHVR